MAEVFVIAAGVLLGGAALRLPTTRARALALALGAPAIALVAGVVSGELEESAAFLVWDTAQALAASVLCMAAVSRLRPRARRTGDRV